MKETRLFAIAVLVLLGLVCAGRDQVCRRGRWRYQSRSDRTYGRLRPTDWVAFSLRHGWNGSMRRRF